MQSEFTSRNKPRAEQERDLRRASEGNPNELAYWTDNYKRYGSDLAKEQVDRLKGRQQRAQKELRDLDH